MATNTVHSPLKAVGERIYQDDALVATCWLQVVKEERQDGESWLDMRNRTKQLRELREKEVTDRAAYIVRACNSYPDLVAALKAVLDDLTIGAHPHLHIAQIDDALSKAEEQA